VTNGTLLDEEHLAEALDAGVEVMGISLDGLAATHDRIRVRARPGPSPWSLAVDALARSARRVSTVAITQVNRMNLGELPAMGELLAELGVPRWQLQLAIPAGRALEIDEPFVLEPEHLEELVAFLLPRLRARSLPLIDVSDTIGYCTGEDALFRGHRRPDGSIAPGAWLGCTAGLTSLAITYDGRVRGCSLLPEELDAGSLHDEPLAAIWNDAHRFAYTTEFHPSRLSGSCAGCRLGGLCRGGCTTLAYFSTGSVTENPYCLRAQRGHP
jgi:radical SAM protein with 4Fe4S-binding SPASM domain